jgi:hypothetical protein
VVTAAGLDDVVWADWLVVLPDEVEPLDVEPLEVEPLEVELEPLEVALEPLEVEPLDVVVLAESLVAAAAAAFFAAAFFADVVVADALVATAWLLPSAGSRPAASCVYMTPKGPRNAAAPTTAIARRMRLVRLRRAALRRSAMASACSRVGFPSRASGRRVAAAGVCMSPIWVPMSAPFGQGQHRARSLAGLQRSLRIR